jgi:endonuclease-3
MAPDPRRRTTPTVPALLDRLEELHGRQEPGWPVAPYDFIVWWNCGYPASDAACAMGWRKIKDEVGLRPRDLLGARPPELAAALKAGGIVPQVRAARLQEIARRVRDEFGGDLSAALAAAPQARKILKTFPGIADPGADRILLFAGIEPVAAVPSNGPQVLVRILHGREGQDYGAYYRSAQRAIDAGVPATFEARKRAYLLLKRHGQEICKRASPRCEACPLRPACAYYRAVGEAGD